MKKFMAICLAMLMALSMVSFSVMAEEAVDFAVIANGQPQKFVTSDLVLDGHTITSSNKLVIAEDGTVTRPLMEDAVVQVAIDGGEAIDVTVKAKTVEALYVNDFSADVLDPEARTGGGWNYGDGWYMSSANNGGSVIENGKFYLNYTDEYPADSTPENVSRVWLYKGIPAAVTDQPVTIQFDVADIEDVAVGIDIRLTGYLLDAEGGIVGEVMSSNGVMRLTAAGFGGSWAGGYRKENVTLKYDPVTGDVWGNGKLFPAQLITTGKLKDGYTAEDVARVSISSYCFVDASDAAAGKFSIDNFIVYQDVAEEDVLANATDEEKLAYFVGTYASFLEAEYVANGNALSAIAGDLNFAAEEELPDGVEIIWEAEDADLIAADGTVARPFFEEKATTITGKLVIDGEEAASVTYDVNVLPLSMGSATEILDADNYEVGTLEGAVGWSPAAVKVWERMEVKEDADGKYFSFCASSYMPSGSQPRYTFASVPAIGEGETLVFDAKVRVPVKGGLANWGLLLNNQEMAEFIYYNNYLYDNDYDLGSDVYYGAGAARSDKNITANKWYDIRFEITEDAAAAKGWTVKCYIDGQLVGTHSTKAAVPAEITSAAFVFTGRSNMDSVKDAEVTTPVYFFDLDDVRVYTTKSVDAVVAGLDDAGKVSFFKELLATTEVKNATAGQALALNDAVAAYDLDALGVTIDWKSDNTEYITDAGVVNKLAEIGEEVVVDMTATISAGAASDEVTVEVALTDGTVLIKKVDYTDAETAPVTATELVTDDAAHGKAIYMKNATAAHKSSTTIANISGAGRGDRVVFEADVKYVHGASESCYGAVRLCTYAGKPGIQVGLNYKTGNISLITTTAEVDGSASSIKVTESKTVTYPMPASVVEKGEGEWVKVTIDHNVLSQTYTVYVDDVLINEVPLLQASMDIGSNGGSAIRGYSMELSLEGEMWIDNVSLKRFANTDAVEVNAALNAALVEYASPAYKSVLTNCEFAPMTIGKSWINGTAYKRDLKETVTENADGTTKTTYSIKPSNPSTYKYVTDGPQLTYAVNGEAVTALDVDKAGVVDLTITATANGITESKTVSRKVAPVAIRGLAQGTASCLNGIWLEGAKGTEKVIIAQCTETGAIFYDAENDWTGLQIIDLAEITNAEKGLTFNPETGLLKNTGVSHPSVSDVIAEVRIIIIGEDGFAPVTFKSGMKDW